MGAAMTRRRRGSRRARCRQLCAFEKRRTGIFGVKTGYRFYNPESGRWLNRDPIEEDGGLSVYVFVENGSVIYIDFLGLCTATVISKHTCKGDAEAWKGEGGSILSGVSSNDDMIEQLEGLTKGGSCSCIKTLNLSGHGYSGGVSWGDKRGFYSDSLKSAQQAKLKSLLCPDAKVSIWSCDSANAKAMPYLQELSNKLGVPVSGINGSCKPGSNGGVIDDAIRCVGEVCFGPESVDKTVWVNPGEGSVPPTELPPIQPPNKKK